MFKNNNSRTSLVVQCLQICLSMQGTRIQSLVQEDLTHLGATETVHHPEPMCLEPALRNKRSYGNEKPRHRNEV